VGRSALELVAPMDRDRVARYVGIAIKQGLVRGGEFTMLRADGSQFLGELSTSALRDASGNLVGHVSICRDITERKKIEEVMKLAAEEWRKTFDSITDGISIHDRDFRIQRVNKAFAEMFGMEPEQIIGKHCYELHNGAKPMLDCPHQRTLATKKPAAAEFYESHLGKFLSESTSPIFNDEGQVIGTVHITRDITSQKQQNERLMMTDRLASLGELAAGAAHELNNPLTSIIGFAQLLKEKDMPDDVRQAVEYIYTEAQRAASVINNLLRFGRKHVPVKQLSQINTIIDEVLRLRTHEHKLNGIEVRKQLASDLPEIMVDYFQMVQVFLNIIINAEYFMIEAHGKGTLTIITEKQNSNVIISIADDGPGIPQENLGRIFDPFFTTKPVGKGTGLGLSICHTIVAQHGGQIYARSQLGKGATFIVELPISQVGSRSIV
jgi:PAS domain S-box-containing protein